MEGPAEGGLFWKGNLTCPMCAQCWTHSDAVILGADSNVVAFPGHGGLRVTTWRHTLQYSRLTSSHHHITRCLPEIISQYWRKRKRNLISSRRPVCLVCFKQRLEIRPADHWAAAQTHDSYNQKEYQFCSDIICLSWANHIFLLLVGWKEANGEKMNYSVCMTAQMPGNVLVRLYCLFTFSQDRVLLCCHSCQSRLIMHISRSDMK